MVKMMQLGFTKYTVTKIYNILMIATVNQVYKHTPSAVLNFKAIIIIKDIQTKFVPVIRNLVFVYVEHRQVRQKMLHKPDGIYTAIPTVINLGKKGYQVTNTF